MVNPQLKSQTFWGNTKASRKLLVHVSIVSLINPIAIVKRAIDKKWAQESPNPTLLPPYVSGVSPKAIVYICERRCLQHAVARSFLSLDK